MAPDSNDKRLTQLFVFLLVFLAAAVAFAVAGHLKLIGSGEAFTFLDAKGIITGPGTFLALLIAALIALTIFVGWKRQQSARALPRKQFLRTENEIRARDEWLAWDALGNASPPPADWTSMSGTFRARRATVERLDSTRQLIRLETQSALDLKVWRHVGDQSEVTADGPFKTADIRFEQVCDWQSSDPQQALAVIVRPGTTSILKQLSLLTKNVAVADAVKVADGQISSGMDLSRGHDIEQIVLTLHYLDLLAGACEGKNPAAFQGPLRSRTFLSHTLNLLLLTIFILTPLALAWTGGSYQAAKWFGLWAGMGCFFTPLMLLALFVFTRSEQSAGGDSLERENQEFDDTIALFHQVTASDTYISELLKKHAQRQHAR